MQGLCLISQLNTSQFSLAAVTQTLSCCGSPCALWARGCAVLTAGSNQRFRQLWDGCTSPRPSTAGWPLTPALWHRETSRTLNYGHREQEQGAAFLGGISSPLREWQRWTEWSHFPLPPLTCPRAGGAGTSGTGALGDAKVQESSCSARGHCFSIKPSPCTVPQSL